MTATAGWIHAPGRGADCPHPARFPRQAGGPADFAFAQARLQAWHGRRLSESEWRQLLAVQGFTLFLKQARGTTLHPFLQNVGDQATVPELETLLLLNFHCHVRHVAGWIPAPWRDSVLRVGELPALPGRQTPRSEAPPVAAGDDLLSLWLDDWRATWPEGGRATRSLEALVALLQQHRLEVAHLPGAREAWEARARLDQTLTLRFRRLAGEPGALFHHLALVALDVERLRGALVRRALFPKETRA